MLNKDESLKMFDIIKDKMTNNNVICFYSLAKLYTQNTISKSSLLYIERCFPMVVETQNFLHLDFSIVAEILGNSELDIHSEVEIFDAVITWLKNKSEKRNNYAKQLLTKVRLSLLSEHALKYVLDEVLLFSEDDGFVNMLKTVLDNNSINSQNRSNICLTNRYCNQNKYNMIICGGYNDRLDKVVSKVQQIDGNDLNKVKDLNNLTCERESFEAVCLKGEVYVFGGRNNTVERYSPSTNEWTEVSNMFDERCNFCGCAFINKIFIFGGSFYSINGYHLSTTSSCLEFNPKRKEFREISEMSTPRRCAACVVFQGNVVVSGGYGNNNYDLNTVESYDVFADKWSRMPDMINSQSFHNLVVVKDKLFVVGQGTEACEVFDNVCKKFVLLKHPIRFNHNQCVPIGNKIIVFQENRSSIVCYDVDEDKWSEGSSEVTKDLLNFSFTKLPQY